MPTDPILQCHSCVVPHHPQGLWLPHLPGGSCASALLLLGGESFSTIQPWSSYQSSELTAFHAKSLHMKFIISYCFGRRLNWGSRRDFLSLHVYVCDISYWTEVWQEEYRSLETPRSEFWIFRGWLFYVILEISWGNSCIFTELKRCFVCSFLFL